MRLTKHVAGILLILLAGHVAVGADQEPTDSLASLKSQLKGVWEDLDQSRKPGVDEAEQEAGRTRYARSAAALAHRAVALAIAAPDSPEAPEALAWVIDGGLGGYYRELAVECDAAYDEMARRHLDSDAILPVVRIAWNHAYETTHAEALLRAAVGRSKNLKVRSLATLSLGRHQQKLADTVRALDHPYFGKNIRKNFSPESLARLLTLRAEPLDREAESLYMKTIHDFALLRPLGQDFPPLGEQAEGSLFRLRHLTTGRTVPEIDGEDIDGKPMKLSQFRGKVVVISFWATWCGPCMEMVPDEKALVDRMKGRPFVLIGVNGDDDRARAKAVAVERGINWRSFWDGGGSTGIPVKWGVTRWPTVYVVDAQGTIRDHDLRGTELDKRVEALVAETEARKSP